MAYDYTVHVGQKFGSLTVVQLIGFAKEFKKADRLRMQVLVRCDCGQEFPVFLQKLKQGYPKTCRACGYKKRHRLKPGDIFDKLTVLGYVHLPGEPHSRVKCRCACGNEVSVRMETLWNNQTNNCGCSHRGDWTGVGELSTTVFGKIRQRAEARHLEFKMTLDALWALYTEQSGKCALSGLPIGFNFRTAGKNTASLDRIDSSKGYVPGNVQWVHKNLNLMKRALSDEEFVNLCRLVVAHHDLKIHG